MKIQGTIQEDFSELFWNDLMSFNCVCHELNERMSCTVDIDSRRVMGMILPLVLNFFFGFCYHLDNVMILTRHKNYNIKPRLPNCITYTNLNVSFWNSCSVRTHETVGCRQNKVFWDDCPSAERPCEVFHRHRLQVLVDDGRVERVGTLSGVVAAQHLFFDDLR